MRGKPDTAATIGRIAGRQHGVVSRAQLSRAGLTRATIDGLVRSGWLIALHRGVYALGHWEVGVLGRAMAAVLACGKGAVLSHESAAALWRLLRGRFDGPVHVIARAGKTRDGIVVHRTRSPPRGDVTRHYGIPVTTTARTLLDLSDRLPLDALEGALAEAEVRKLVRPEALASRATGALRAALGTAAPTRSRLERRFLRFVAEHGLPTPVINGFVEGYEVDAHWPEARLVVEVDGYEFHRHRAAFEADRERDGVLQAAGWRVVRVTERQFDRRGAATAHLLRGMIARGAEA